MPLQVENKAIVDRLPPDATPISDEQITRLKEDAIGAIELAFWERGRNFANEVQSSPMLAKAATFVVYEMVASHVVAAGRKGLRSVSSATGAISDRWEFADGDQTGWAGALLTRSLLARLGLTGVYAMGSFPEPKRWPEVIIDGAG